MSKIVSFGDSFIFGYEIPENYDGSAGWPAIAAKQMGIEFVNKSSPGSSNQSILRRILDYYSIEENSNDLAVINWSWSHRWAYFVNQNNWNTWINFGPTKRNEPFLNNLEIEELTIINTKNLIYCPGKGTINIDYQKQLESMYIEYISDNQMFNKFQSLQSIYCATTFFLNKNIKFVQTNMDEEILEKQWFCDRYIDVLQNFIMPYLSSFDDKNFLDWSFEKGFKITDPGWHPLEDAHATAAEYWLPTYKKLLDL